MQASLRLAKRAITDELAFRSGVGAKRFVAELSQLAREVSAMCPPEELVVDYDDAAFDAVRLALAGVKEGALAAYTFEKGDAVLVEDKAPGAAEAEADGFEMV